MINRELSEVNLRSLEMCAACWLVMSGSQTNRSIKPDLLNEPKSKWIVWNGSFFSIYIIFNSNYLAEAFMQSDLQMRTIETIKTSKRAIICHKVLY